MTFGRVLIKSHGGLEDTLTLLAQAMESMGYCQAGGRASHRMAMMGREQDAFYVLECDLIDDQHTEAMDAFASHYALAGGKFGIIVLCMDSDIMWAQLNDGKHQSLLELGPIDEPDYGQSTFTPGCWHSLLRTEDERAALDDIRMADYDRAEDAVAPLGALLGFDAESVLHGAAAHRILWNGTFKKL